MNEYIDVKNIKIDELDLSVRAYNGLVKARIFTVGQILKNPKEVINIKQIGQKTLSEIDQVLGTEYCYLLQEQIKEMQRLERVKTVLQNRDKMKLQIVKETKIIGDDKPWYRLLADGEYVMGDYNLSNVESVYEIYRKDPENFSTTRVEILKSEEV